MLLANTYAVATPSPFDDRWYTSGSIVYLGDRSLVDNEAALKVSTVWRAVNLLAASVAMLPIDVYTRLPDRENGKSGGKKVARKDPWRRRLRGKPNRVQTSFTWRQHLVGHLVLSGNYYAQIINDEQLWPLDPTKVRIKRIESDGSLVYQHTRKDGSNDFIPQDEMFHVRGFSRDGLVGVSVLDLMRENTALALASRRQRTAFVKNEMRPSVVVKHPGELGDKGRENLGKGYKRAFGGPSNAGEILVLDEGMDISSFSINSKDAQYIESEHFQVEEFLRYLGGVPGVLVGLPNSASGVGTETFFQSFANYCVHPLVANIETELTAVLYGDDQDETFVEMNLAAMMRPEAAARAQFYNTMVTLGIMTRNEVRELENRDPLPGLDEPLTPTNLGGAANGSGGGPEGAPGSAPQPGGRPPRGPAQGSEEPDDHGLAAGFVRRAEETALARASRATLVVGEAAARLVRKEIAALQSLAKRYAMDPAAWPGQLAAFYEKHAGLVVDALKLTPEEAGAYCARQSAEVLADLRAVEGWEATRPAELLAITLGAAPPVPPGTTVTVPVTVQPAAVTVPVEVHPAAATVVNRVNVEAPAAPVGPTETRIVGTVDARVTEMPAPPVRDVEVVQRDTEGRIKRTRETPRG